MKKHYDVIIVGGGMVGATQALALSQQIPSLSIALIESRLAEPVTADEPYDLRVSALTHSSECLLKNLGIWSELNHRRLSPFTNMQVWETPGSELNFDSADLGEATLGHLIENRHLQSTSLYLCKQQTNIDVIAPANPIAYEPGKLILNNKEAVTASLIVAADGTQSQIRHWAGIKHHGWSYRQQGLVCTVTTEKPHQKTAWQRFLPEGPLAFLPLPNPHQSSIVWTVNDASVERLLALDEAPFRLELEQAFSSHLGHITTVSERAAFPLQLQHASQYVQPKLALVGDAAHTIHPLAGQGVNIGLLDAACLTQVLQQAMQHGRDIGSLHTLQKYQRQRRADNMLIQFSMDMFKHVFSSQLPPIKWLRKLGLQSVNDQIWLKNLFISQASNRSFAQPVLCKIRHR